MKRKKSRSRKSPQHFMAVMIVLTVITWIVGLLDLHFKEGETIGFVSGFPGTLSEWAPSGDKANILLQDNAVFIQRNSPEESYALRTFPLPTPAELGNQKLRVQGILQTLTPASELPDDEVAAFMIWFKDENRETIKYTTIQALTGDDAIYTAERVVSVPDDARYYVIALINRQSDGDFALTDASVTLVSSSLAYIISTTLIFAMWAVTIITAIVWLLRRSTRQLGIVTGVLIVLTIVGIVLPESVSNLQALPLYRRLTSTLSFGDTDPLVLIYKTGHFLFFFGVSLCLMLGSRALRLSLTMIIGFMVVFAIATEGLQLFLFNRSTRLFDMSVDIAGVLLAFIVASIILAIRNHGISTDTSPGPGTSIDSSISSNSSYSTNSNTNFSYDTSSSSSTSTRKRRRKRTKRR